MPVEYQKLIPVAGLNYDLLLDDRLRIRLPDELADLLRDAVMKQIEGADIRRSEIRLAFYLAPGTNRRLLLYPRGNHELATEAVERPRPGLDPVKVRSARNHFYYHFQYVEADKFNRLTIPERHRKLIGLGEEGRKIMLRAKKYYFEIMSEQAFEHLDSVGRNDFEEVGDDLLDPVDPWTGPQGEALP